MKFKALRPFIGQDFVVVTRFLATTLKAWSADLLTGLQNLTFRDNFQCFVEDFSLIGGGDTQIPNRFQSPAIDVVFMNHSSSTMYLISVTDQFIKFGHNDPSPAVGSALVIKR
jgi:hypothetical protein